ncbi:hypothetical protein [Epibacterium ulvae]|uniref:hypothetical protein n=1 Tax=Epibacterium ulvae TaxID=1156985 RepID=UPI0024913ADB|nr:hypothetical protein [Epibacterium ulvae]
MPLPEISGNSPKRPLSPIEESAPPQKRARVHIETPANTGLHREKPEGLSQGDIYSEGLKKNAAAAPSHAVEVNTPAEKTSPSPKYETSDKNPVKGPFSLEEGAKMAQKMLDNIQHLQDPPKDDVSNLGSIQAVMSAKTILEGIADPNLVEGESEADDDYVSEVYAYLVNDEPVGLMVGEQRETSYYIADIVSDPYARGAGTALIERAVDVSVKETDGVLELWALDENVVPQYQSLGFELEDDTRNEKGKLKDLNMTLQPEASDKWIRSDDGDQIQYKYAKNADDRYLTGFGKD